MVHWFDFTWKGSCPLIAPQKYIKYIYKKYLYNRECLLAISHYSLLILQYFMSIKTKLFSTHISYFNVSMKLYVPIISIPIDAS